MTYKKAIRLCTKILKDQGLQISRHAQKQLGYLVLFGTEGEISKNLSRELKEILKKLPEEGLIKDEEFLLNFNAYAETLKNENPGGGEITMGWLVKECGTSDWWSIFKRSL